MSAEKNMKIHQKLKILEDFFHIVGHEELGTFKGDFLKTYFLYTLNFLEKTTEDICMKLCIVVHLDAIYKRPESFF